MPTNTTYNPPNINSFVKTALSFNANGVSTTVSAGSVTNLDYTLADDCLLTGLQLIINDGAYGDTVDLQIIDISGIYSNGVPNTVLLQPVSNWCVSSITNTQFDLSYPSKILTGMTLRAIFHSIGTSDSFFAVNYKLHKCLI